jgi:hypothetical protein
LSFTYRASDNPSDALLRHSDGPWKTATSASWPRSFSPFFPTLNNKKTWV